MKRLLSGTVHAIIDMGQAGLSVARIADQAAMAVIAGSNRTTAGAGFAQCVAARGETDKTDTKERCILVVGYADNIKLRC
jgi:hypothetical protein